jgi:hypothetical protein
MKLVTPHGGRNQAAVRAKMADYQGAQQAGGTCRRSGEIDRSRPLTASNGMSAGRRNANVTSTNLRNFRREFGDARAALLSAVNTRNDITKPLTSEVNPASVSERPTAGGGVKGAADSGGLYQR